LLTACWDHNLDWFPSLWRHYGRDSGFFLRNAVNMLIKLGTGPIRRRVHATARKHGALI
jgi:hypothetical protein